MRSKKSPRAGLATTVASAVALLGAPAVAAPNPVHEQPVAEAPPAAHAPEARVDVPGGRLRLHIEGSLVGWSHTRAVADPMLDVPEGHELGFGLGRPGLIDRALGAWGLGLGFTLPGDRAVLGGQFSLSVSGTAAQLDGRRWDTRAAGRIIPYLRWMFRPGHTLRPYIEGHAGIGAVNMIDKVTSGDRTELTTVFPVFGGGLGLHYFPIHQISLDLGLRIDYLPVFVRANTRDDAGRRQRGNFERLASLVDAGITGGLSVWFGGGRPRG